MKSLLLRTFDRLAARASSKTRSIGRMGGSFDIIDIAFWQAAVEAAAFYEENLLNAKVFVDTLDMIKDGVGIADPDGLFLEFGVASGRTITAIGEARSGPVYGFDSFEGLPEDWYEGYRQGHFARSDLPKVPQNVTLVKGWFTDTLPDFLKTHPGKVSYVNVDCDLYSSASFVLKTLADRIGPGCVIQFDEFFNYPGWRDHEFKAFHEFVELTGHKFKYRSFLRNHQALCVVIG